MLLFCSLVVSCSVVLLSLLFFIISLNNNNTKINKIILFKITEDKAFNTQSIHCDNSSTQTPIVFPFSYNLPILKQSATFNTESSCSPLLSAKNDEFPSTFLSKPNLNA